MSGEENKAVVKRYYELMNQHQYNELSTLWSNEAIWHGNEGDVKGYEEYRHPGPQKLISFDKTTLEELIAEGDRVVARWSSTGKLNKNDAPVTLRGISIYTVKNGKIFEEWYGDDSMVFLREHHLIKES